MTLRTVLLSLQALLAAAEPDDPQDAVVAKQYKDCQEIFIKTARHWTNIYAGGLYIHIYLLEIKSLFLYINISCYQITRLQGCNMYPLCIDFLLKLNFIKFH